MVMTYVIAIYKAYRTPAWAEWKTKQKKLMKMKHKQKCSDTFLLYIYNHVIFIIMRDTKNGEDKTHTKLI